MARRKEFKIDWEIKFDRPLRLKLIQHYNKGYGLRELCRMFDTDISTTLEIIRRKKIKKRNLYEIYKNQDDRKETIDFDLILKREKILLEKYFPVLQPSEFTYSYFWYWKEQFDKKKKKKEKCKHQYKHICCALCSKILGDATKINLDSVKVYKKE